jgi:hypothetical protein
LHPRLRLSQRRGLRFVRPDSDRRALDRTIPLHVIDKPRLRLPQFRELPLHPLSYEGGFVVRSRDFKSVYFVSADLQGPGLNGKGEIATWATNKLRVGGLIYSADAVARAFFDWGRGPGFSVGDGFSESRSCARRAIP